MRTAAYFSWPESEKPDDLLWSHRQYQRGIARQGHKFHRQIQWSMLYQCWQTHQLDQTPQYSSQSKFPTATGTSSSSDTIIAVRPLDLKQLQNS